MDDHTKNSKKNPPYTSSHSHLCNLIYKFTTSVRVCVQRQFCILIHGQNRGAAAFSMAEPGFMLIWALQLQLESFKPINRIHCHLYAFHFYVYDMSRQVEAHHYCMHYNQDMRQCAILIRHLGCQTSWKHGLLRMQSFMSLQVYNGLHSLEVLDSK
jgi:hypothetical protein